MCSLFEYQSDAESHVVLRSTAKTDRIVVNLDRPKVEMIIELDIQAAPKRARKSCFRVVNHAAAISVSRTGNAPDLGSAMPRSDHRVGEGLQP